MGLFDAISEHIKNNANRDFVSEMTDGLTGGMSEAIKDVDTSAFDEKTKEFASQAATNAATLMQTTAAKDLTAAMPDVAGKAFKKGKNNSAMASTVADVAKGTAEAMDKVESILPGSFDALSKPVAFTTKTLQDTIAGLDLGKLTDMLTKPLSTLDGFDGLQQFSGGLLDTVEKYESAINNTMNSFTTMMSDGVNTIQGVLDSATGMINSAISGITTSVGNIVNTAQSAIGGAVGSITGGTGTAIAGVKDFAGSFMSDITNTLSGVLDSTGVNSILGDVQGIGSKIWDKLPKGLTDFVSAKSNSFLSDTINSVLGDKADSFNNILSMLTGSNINSSDLLAKFLKLGDSSIYALFTDPSGASLDSLLGNKNDSTLGALYSAAGKLCNGINVPSKVNYRYNKDLMDVLTQLATEYGMTDLLDQLMNCKNGDKVYADGRSKKLLNSLSTSVAKKGNAEMYSVMQEHIGPSEMSWPTKDSITLIANTKGSSDNYKRIDNILSNFNLSADKLLTAGKVGNTTIYSGGMTTVMSSTDTHYTDSVFGADNRNLIKQAVYSYA